MFAASGADHLGSASLNNILSAKAGTRNPDLICCFLANI